ncbi:flagellar basal body rod protein FlgB [Natroniella sulfidigena]|uniref:flagellar basal body rod protein FlgB n=1 Tax=Natroniella sulfidigena TaxID=723921 RepID=UPI00200A6FBF|nr:flagellar basal body rod protein FlgB [Natroniella sulfidigena]MCK8816537.1 flagellar basal body rod protein FlgB [Natroniella sulfidigena]
MFNNKGFGVLEKSLDGLNKRHQVLSNNISNVDTPGYKRQDVSFKDEMAKALGGESKLNTTNTRHISVGASDLNEVKPQVHTIDSTNVRNDENNVNIDAEMSKLSQNTLEYQTVSQKLASQFQRLDSVIQKGGR